MDQPDTPIPKVPLLKQLNTFFLSRNGRRRTTYTPSSQSTKSTRELGEMAPASLTNYRIAGVPNRPSIKNGNMMFLHDRHDYANLPIKMKMVKNSQIADDQKIRTIDLRKYSSLAMKRFNMDETAPLPQNHILRAKTILGPTISTTALQDYKTASTREIDRSRHETPASQSQKESKQQTLEAINQSTQSQSKLSMSLHRLIRNYSDHGRNPYSNNLVDNSSVGKNNYSKAELFDYSAAGCNRLH